jgi:hypothetical protein
MNQLLQCCANLATWPVLGILIIKPRLRLLYQFCNNEWTLLGIFVIKPRLELLSLACHNDISSQEFCVLICCISPTMM